MNNSKRVANNLMRNMFVLEDETDPRGTQIDNVWPATVLDQVFDQNSPTNKNLREILADLKHEILTGGIGNIVFPVTTVNGKTEDVVLTANDFKLGRVDNTSDMDKPLSTPQKDAIMEILGSYDFNVNLEDLHDHLMDTTNPHQVSLEQINKDEILTQFIQRLITAHSLSTHSSVHLDIRRSLSKLWILVENTNTNIADKVEDVLNAMTIHSDDVLAHDHLFIKKEDVENKAQTFSKDSNSTHKNYPSTRAVVDFVTKHLEEFRGTLPDVKEWIDDIRVVDNRESLPPANNGSWRRLYFIRKGITSHEEIAICRKNPDNTFSWDYSSLGAISKFNKDHFKDSTEGLSINMSSVIDAILSENGTLDTSLSEILKDYYTRDEIDNKEFVQSIKIIPGTMTGTIRYYINEDMTTMSDDIKVSGLKRLAYLEWISEDELLDQSVHERHILSDSVAKRHIQKKAVDPDKMTCEYGFLLGNTNNADEDTAHEVKLTQLADILRPLIGGWPDPTVPGGNPWSDMLADRIVSPQLWTPGVEHYMHDHSYAIRFTGKISIVPNMDIKTLLSKTIKLDECQLMDAGGSWMYSSNPKAWTVMGGSNITGHTFATVNMDETGLYLETISIGDRMDADYDIWVKYIKPAELNQFLNPRS